MRIGSAGLGAVPETCGRSMCVFRTTPPRPRQLTGVGSRKIAPQSGRTPPDALGTWFWETGIRVAPGNTAAQSDTELEPCTVVLPQWFRGCRLAVGKRRRGCPQGKVMMQHLSRCGVLALMCCAGSLVLLPVVSRAQDVLSARPALIHYVEGKVLLFGGPTEDEAVARVRHLGDGDRLVTKTGWAELLLAPGIMLRAGPQTNFEMVKADLSNLSVRLLSGSALIHVVKGSYRDVLSVSCGDSVVRFSKKGLYRVDAPTEELPRLKVLSGKAVVSMGGVEHEVTEKWSLPLVGAAGQLVPEKFDRSRKDALQKWHKARVATQPKSEGPDPYGPEVGCCRAPPRKLGPPPHSELPPPPG